ncbi:NADPH-dependent methylglyoxal reductase GRE2 protein (ketoreductase) [Colletotrichum tofieldiae]|uniref:NADPH-dependent methylglyoxal reductase GRE2 protein (Ketoreductase) n=1 Tax=Colletotrichum tofieldiae TaxID=708197 RepID=A0A161V332_9PEZI|nr:NADPH-dependent methylglyoxal reductase GRE2 protein (ketoreductase) [Colletotrichum tofieldiae]GKT95352.1 NADPH-dependent methylglyoxal reductase GRE2 protein [Colletotrichum tofieldiae]
MTKVLVTGGTGFVAGHVIDVLLKRGHTVLTTVRSQEKAKAIKEAYQDVSYGHLDTVIIPNIASEDAFHGLEPHGIEAVIHLASPFHYNVTDPKKDLIDPAVLGTIGVLKAIKDFCPNVKRVVVTSSFAAILDPSLISTGTEKTYSEEDWSPLTLEDAYSNGTNAYIVSKLLAEKAAWNFVATEKPNFTLSTINPTMVYGPVRQPVKSLSAVNTSNQLLAEVILGKHKAGLPPTALPLWVDVRDVALAHVKAMEIESAAGKRFFTTAGFYSNHELANVVWKHFPGLHDKLPVPSDFGGAPNPFLKSFGFDTSRARNILGLDWKPYEETIVDSVKSLIGLQE